MIFVYNRNSLLFIQRLKAMADEIIAQEVRPPTISGRYVFAHRICRPEIVVFEHPRTLGLFEQASMRIGINKKLMYLTQISVLKNIIRHELAHYLCHLEIMGKVNLTPGRNEFHHQAHGPDYRHMCQRFGWGEEVFSATAHLSELGQDVIGDLETDRLIERIKKLMSLSSSDNTHEAQQATLRANQLLFKHNLQHLDKLGVNEDREIHMAQVLRGPRINTKMNAIASILKHFFVSPVFCTNQQGAVLEITGRAVNIKVASHVATYLDHEFERLWKKAQKENTNWRGLRSKNSFYHGLSSGYEEKMKSQVEQPHPDSRQLVLLERLAKEEVAMVYRSTSRSRSNISYNPGCLQAGHQAGRNLSIRSALNSQQGNTTHYLEA